MAAGLRVARVLAIRDGGEAGMPRPYDTDMAYEVALPRVEQAEAPPVPPGLTTSQVTMRVDFALSD